MIRTGGSKSNSRAIASVNVIVDAIVNVIVIVNVIAFALAPSTARAGGFGRPNEIDARAIGMGGAFAAVADDPWAIWHNPSGLAFPDETQVSLDLALLSLNRQWTPPSHATIDENTAPQIVPGIAGSTRFAFGRDKPARLALGVGFYVSYGGKISFDPAAVANTVPNTMTGTNAGITETGITLFEVTPAVAYQVADVLSLGFVLRVGIATFDVNDDEPAFSASNLSATGAGIGASFSATLRPHPRVSLAAVYRTTLSTTVTGNGNISVAKGPSMKRDMSLDIVWPQSASLGVSVRVLPFLRLAAQGDWTAWSSIQQLVVQFSPAGTLSQTKQMQFNDSFTLHLGAEGTFSRFAVRAGFAVDGNAIPDATTRRETRDGMKYDATVGFGVRVWRLRIDAAFDYLFGTSPRVIPLGLPNAEAGSYTATVLTFALTTTIVF